MIIVPLSFGRGGGAGVAGIKKSLGNRLKGGIKQLIK